MWLGAMLLLLSTVGVLLTARIALAVLMALGPVFVVLALFGGTRGLTAGWLKGVALTAIAPLFVVLGSAITLELLVPVISALSQSAALGEIGGRAALALFLVAAVHSALMALILKVAATITAGWKVFGMAGTDSAVPDRNEPTALLAPHLATRHAQEAPASPRTAARGPLVAPVSARPGASADVPAGTPASPGRRQVTTLVAGGGIEPLRAPGPGRASGIGSRFRAASNDSARGLFKTSGRETAR
jgi:type IV secretion system protein VirB6